MFEQAPQTATNAGGSIVMVFAIVVWATSPAKWQTFKKMTVAFVATLVLGILLAFLLGWLQGNPEMTGAITELSVYIAVLASALMGRQYVKSLKKSESQPQQQ